jgi:hypothetical protein
VDTHRRNKITKLTPKETNIIDDIVRSANPLFFGKLSKLLGLPFPATIEEKERILIYILEAWRKEHAWS